MLAQYYYRPMMDNQDWGWSLFMMLFWTVVLILIVYFVVRLLKSHEANEKKSPIDIVKERYAKGEIKKEEFEQIKKDLAGV